MSTPVNKDQFIAIISQNKKLIYKVCNSYCRDAADREDLVQEVIIRLWQAFGNYNPDYKLSTWMYRIALNTAISHYRAGKRRNESTVSLQENLIEIADENPEIELDENVKRLYEFINQLNELNRALMILYLDDNSYREIAEILGITETNVATRINRVKQQLKQQFAKN
ncbi:RNA polymerase sigma factor [Mucilaginibacter sp. X5P1]|uniref:RNA polymerase sigma factor n=1 Tax=Mucilaginibacter sp. X5P1 TaxID=2723088 RepID=UPI0016096134|nr:sigma-70 family RNA polymerase sigma factor [Mucilaginibacter sp. X5P1]MBB6140547.1 RNA polymerase sigma-70 factor (ECF subfamily) [Mucilaginibacter sp. X5P1]